MTCSWPGHQDFTAAQRREFGCVTTHPWCDEHKMNHSNRYECARMKDNAEMRNGHRAGICPARIDVRTCGDANRPHWTHGDCMPGMPEVSTKDGVVTITTQNGEHERVTYTGALDGSYLQINSPLGAGRGDVTLTLDLSSVARTCEAVHADPHFQEVRKHGKLCVCGCKSCKLRAEDSETLCNCGQCDC